MPILTRYHNDSMVNYEEDVGRVEVQRHTNGWGSTLLVIFDNFVFFTFQNSTFLSETHIRFEQQELVMVETSLVPHTGFRTGRLRIKKKETDLK